MKEIKTLYFFTATYPYGLREVFIEDEIRYLSREFDKIVMIPMYGKGNPTRSLPDNCFLLNPIVTSRWNQYAIGLFMPLSLPVFIKDFLKKKVYLKTSRMKTWLIAYILSNNLLFSSKIKSIFKNISPKDVCYFYWGKGSNVLAYFYKEKSHFVSRFHGEWDLWEESSGNYAPIREQVSSNLDCAIFISRIGEKYFNIRYPNCPTMFIPLGTADKGVGIRSNDGVLRVVSCSTIYWLKRVDLIFNALCMINDRKIEWYHIGIGPDEETLKEKVEKECPNNLKVNFVGRLKHDDVYNFYKSNKTDVFVNASMNEGVPVSIMEAISFNIPIVATNVGGTSEVVTDETGILVSPNPTAQELATAILKVQLQRFTPRVYWMKHYSADINYMRFAKILNSLS